MEVQLAWLEDDAVADAVAKAKVKSAKRRSKPPRLPGAAMTMPPMPATPSRVPPRRNTMEVELDWLELSDERSPEADPTKADGAKPDAASAIGAAATMRPKASDKPARKRHKPIPREEPD